MVELEVIEEGPILDSFKMSDCLNMGFLHSRGVGVCFEVRGVPRIEPTYSEKLYVGQFVG